MYFILFKFLYYFRSSHNIPLRYLRSSKIELFKTYINHNCTITYLCKVRIFNPDTPILLSSTSDPGLHDCRMKSLHYGYLFLSHLTLLSGLFPLD